MQKVLIIGGGTAGLAAAHELSKRMVGTIMIERSDHLGGRAAELSCKGTNECARCDACLPIEKMDRIGRSALAEVLTNASVTDVLRTEQGYRVTVLSETQGMIALDVGAIIVATGSVPFDPAVDPRYHYGSIKNVLTSVDVEKKLLPRGRLFDAGAGSKTKRMAIVQCVGSRDGKRGAPYCSKACCKYAFKTAQLLKRSMPELEITFFYMDWRPYDLETAELARWASSEKGTNLVRSRPSEIVPSENGLPMVRFTTPEEEVEEREFDLVMLSVGMLSDPSSSRTADILHLSRDENGFLSSDEGNGIFAAGCCTGPMDIDEAYMEGVAAAGSAYAFINRSVERSTGPNVLIVGSGESAKLAAEEVCRQGLKAIVVGEKVTGCEGMTSIPDGRVISFSRHSDHFFTEIRTDLNLLKMHCGAAILIPGSGVMEKGNTGTMTLSEMSSRSQDDSWEPPSNISFVLDADGPNAAAEFGLAMDIVDRTLDRSPNTRLTIISREFLAFGVEELRYKRAQSRGVLFIRTGSLPRDESGILRRDDILDIPSGSKITIVPKLLVIADHPSAASIAPFSTVFRTPSHGDAELLKGNVKRKPLMTVREGIVVLGGASYPYTASNVGLQARAAATIAVSTALGISKKEERPLAKVEEDKCSACLTCVRSCPYGAPSINEKGKAFIDELVCQGCGICAASCPSKAIEITPKGGSS